MHKQDRDEVEQETVARVAATSAKKTHAERNVMCPREDDTKRERGREREKWQPTSQRYDSCLNVDWSVWAALPFSVSRSWNFSFVKISDTRRRTKQSLRLFSVDDSVVVWCKRIDCQLLSLECLSCHSLIALLLQSSDSFLMFLVGTHHVLACLLPSIVGCGKIDPAPKMFRNKSTSLTICISFCISPSLLDQAFSSWISLHLLASVLFLLTCTHTPL
jgi:hypothetical protein